MLIILAVVTQASAQGSAPKREELVGTWAKVLDTSREKWRDHPKHRGHLLVWYLTLKADGTFEAFNDRDGERLDPFRGWGFYPSPGPSPVVPDSWALTRDTIKFGGRGPGRSRRYHVMATGKQLVLSDPEKYDAYRSQDSLDVAGKKPGEAGYKRYVECFHTFTRVDSSTPLPSPVEQRECRGIELDSLSTPKRSVPTAAELVGSWAFLDTPMCMPSACSFSYDTLTFRADSTLLQKQVWVSPEHPEGKLDPSTIPQMRWWIASDTLWTSWRTAKGGRPIWWEEDGERYLMIRGQPYHRVAP